MMLRNLKKMLIFLFFISFHNTALAQFYIEETFFPVYVSKNDVANPGGGAIDKDVPTESGLGFDLRTTIGYVFSFQMLLGLTYNYYSVDTSRPVTVDYEGLETTTAKSELGPTIGYLLGSWRFALTYFLTADKEVTQKYTDTITHLVTVDEVYKNTNGSGFQFAVGYRFALGAGFEISPTLIYRTVRYSKQSYTVNTGSGTPYASSTLQTKAIDDELKPMITVTYTF